jgi:phospholipid/cholesterol/gamma-HCH transport system substrate-binding protein
MGELMDQSKFNNKDNVPQIPVPKRSISLEFFVGLFAAAGVAAAAYLAVGLAGLELNDSDNYTIYAEFDNISGLKYGASVEIAGVPIGVVSDINLNDPVARVALKLDRAVRIKDDDIASIRTKGIIGDRYVKISRGASDTFVPEGGTLFETESVVDIEDVIGKVVHSLTGDDKEDESVDDDSEAVSNELEQEVSESGATNVVDSKATKKERE